MHSFEGCSEYVTGSMNGSVRFNASLHLIPGGSCGFEQRITNIKMRNLTSGRNIFNNRISYGVDKVHLMLGISELEIVLNVDSVHRSGAYEVICWGNDPGTGSRIELRKIFYHQGTLIQGATN